MVLKHAESIVWYRIINGLGLLYLPSVFWPGSDAGECDEELGGVVGRHDPHLGHDQTEKAVMYTPVN